MHSIERKNAFYCTNTVVRLEIFFPSSYKQCMPSFGVISKLLCKENERTQLKLTNITTECGLFRLTMEKGRFHSALRNEKR